MDRGIFTDREAVEETGGEWERWEKSRGLGGWLVGGRVLSTVHQKGLLRERECWETGS